jgi:type I restriction enzyme S subunit
MNSSAVLHGRGSVILLRDAGIGKSAILGAEMAVSQHFLAWKCGPALHNEFLYYWFQYMRSEFERISNGSTIKTIGLDYFRQLRIPLPQIREQQEIAHQLADVDRLIASLGRLITKKQALKHSMMQQLLTGKTRLPGFSGAWKLRKIGDFANVTAGGTPSTLVPRYWGGKINWMSSGELHKKRVFDVAGRITEAGLRESSAQILPTGSVLIGLAGQGKTRGTVAVSRIDLATNQSIAGIMPSSEHSSDFLYYNLDIRYDELRAMSTGVGGRGGLNLTIIRAILILMPNVHEQQAIATILTDVDDEMDILSARLQKAKAIKFGMMQELLTGRSRLPVSEALA